MREVNDRNQLNHYLNHYEINHIFNEKTFPHLSLYTFEQGDFICSQGDQAEYMFILVKGKVKVYNTSLEGKALILSFKQPLEVIGDIEYVQKKSLLNTVEAMSPVHMIGIKHEWLRKYADDFTPFLQFLLEIVTRKFYIKSQSMSLNMLYPVEVRLASYLLSVSVDSSSLHGQISTSYLKDTANLIGTSYRHLNRVLLNMTQEGVIERSKDSIIIKDQKRLKELANYNIYE
ncbi:cyclic nucleotide-binding domain-containing protein [Bacillus carboniphilus]|uniref:Cyclic nucleotide-binding domain-containing protein n=1 Tax=Bacillus carboniphilus TaxID=86663 RepID=A0ABY9JRX0_9BACI|nr:cyclic nucleotide-binding domain-containing protein [Bacillus carboniphilus]WLR42156.1 cyclic nucleotide-binding domain-containing protein [Bacillus carboniphilus]